MNHFPSRPTLTVSLLPVDVERDARRGNADDLAYQSLLSRIESRFHVNTDHGKEPLFTTRTPDIWRVYLDSFPSRRRQYHTCRACQAFVERYGGLVTIAPATGRTTPAFWDPADARGDVDDQDAIERLHLYVGRGEVTGVFLSSEATWGTPRTDRRFFGHGDWRHFAVTPPPGAAALFSDGPLVTAAQKMAEKAQDFEQVMRALAEYRPEHLAWAVTLLESEVLYRAEKVLGPARWLRDLQTSARRAAHFRNVVWRAVATAPAGFCHPRSSMISTLLDDLAAGLDFETVKRRFAEKMSPTQYRRPTAPPAIGSIARAEEIVAELGLAPALRRRYARLDDVQEWVWRLVPAPAGGVFADLMAMTAHFGLPRVSRETVTWEKFRRIALPSTVKLEVRVPYSGPFAALVTAVDPAARPILQWDHEDRRNPVSWYVYLGGAGQLATRWSLVSGAWAAVTGVCEQPSMWNGGGIAHQGESVFLLIAGCRDQEPASSCLFPEILRSELHGVRAVIEAHSNRGRLEGLTEATACGLKLQKGAHLGLQVRVTFAIGLVTEYVIDRWD